LIPANLWTSRFTTNGHLLADLAQAAQSRRADSRHRLDGRRRFRDRFARITRVANGYDHVLAGIRRRPPRRTLAAEGELRADARLQRRSDHPPLGCFAREEGVTVRFIEFMPLEEGAYVGSHDGSDAG